MIIFIVISKDGDFDDRRQPEYYRDRPRLADYGPGCYCDPDQVPVPEVVPRAAVRPDRREHGHHLVREQQSCLLLFTFQSRLPNLSEYPDCQTCQSESSDSVVSKLIIKQIISKLIIKMNIIICHAVIVLNCHIYSHGLQYFKALISNRIFKSYFQWI